MTNGISSLFTASLRAGNPLAYWHSCRDHAGLEEALLSPLLSHRPLALPHDPKELPHLGFARAPLPALLNRIVLY